MLRRGLYTASKLALGIGTATGLATLGYRSWKLRGDQVLNPYQDPFLVHAEKERQQGKHMFAPWITSNEDDLSIAKKHFPQISIPTQNSLVKPPTKAVQFVPLKDYDVPKPQDEFDVVTVGGPSAAMIALENTLDGKRVKYVTNTHAYGKNKVNRSIMDGAANLYLPDVLTTSPAYAAGHEPSNFLWNAFKDFVNPPRYDQEVLDDHFPWLSLNTEDFIKNPDQLIPSLRVMWSNHKLASQYTLEMKTGQQEPAIRSIMKERIHNTSEFLESVDAEMGGIFRKPRGALFITADDKGMARLFHEEKELNKEDRQLNLISPKAAIEKYGFAPYHSFTLREKPHGRIFDPLFLKHVSDHITSQHGEVADHLHLTRVFVDTETNQGGVLEFADYSQPEKVNYHYTKFSRAHFSLGATPFDPNPYNLISVTGVSVNALIYGIKLSGGPITRGSVHIVPLAEPTTIATTDPMTGSDYKKDVSYVRMTAGGAVGPADRGENSFSYDGRQAVNLLEQVRKTIPLDSTLKVLSVVGCNRVIGADARQIELNPTVKVDGKEVLVESVTLQMGAGGAGLIQSGALSKMSPVKRNSLFSPQKNEYEHDKPNAKKLNPSCLQ